MQDGKQGAEKAPIIIKKINAGHHGHHGGAWKVAYADFVTAMMAFFLLLWLLNAVPSENLQGVAEYFEPTVGIAGSKGIGFSGGTAKNDSGTSQYDKDQGVKYGVISKGNIISSPQKGTEINVEEIENERFQIVEGELKKMIIADQEMSMFQNNIDFSITPEGLVISLMDQDKYPMFIKSSPELENYAKNILRKIANLIKFSPNFLAITGHTGSDIPILNKGYSNWELSTDRANTARRFIIEHGITTDQIAKVVGRSDTDPLDLSHPNSPKNRRVTITLLRNSVMPYNRLSAPKQVINSR